jgi:catechol 2,3-dioxygenase-like lactoylglutathione lyase family enzyme
MIKLSTSIFATFILSISTLFIPASGQADSVLRRTTLVVSDISQSIEFYSGLGLRPFYDAQKSVETDGSILGGEDLPLAGEPGESRIVILIGPHEDTGMIGLLSYGSPKLPAVRNETEGLGTGDVILMFYVDDIHITRDALHAGGTRFHREPYRYEVRDNQGVIRSSGWRMFAWDPDGRMVEIAQRDE